MNKNETKENLNKLLLSLDITVDEDKYGGLPLYNKTINLVDDTYSNIYNIFTETIINNVQSNNCFIFDYQEIDNFYSL